MDRDQSTSPNAVCPGCGHKYPGAATRCGRCGRELPAPAAGAQELLPTVPMPVWAKQQAAEAPGVLVIGQVLDGKYEVGRLIGEGGMGRVFEGRHLLLGREVAIKSLPTQFHGHPGAARRFLDEGRALAVFAHPHVVQIYDLGVLDGVPYLVMERLHGETLQDILARGRLGVEEVATVGRQILSALEAVHRRGLVHLDLKPGNVFVLEREDRSLDVKIVDFGLSQIVTGSVGGGVVGGTPEYMAPEQILGESLDPRADLWAAGVTLYEALTGELPFGSRSVGEIARRIANDEPPSPSALRPEVPRELSAVVMRSLAKRREDRFPDAGAMLRALRGVSAAVDVVASREIALIATADALLVGTLRGAATACDLEPIVASDGMEARELLDALGVPRLLLIDLGLPGEDGFSLLRGLGRPDPRQECAVVAFSPVSAYRAAARAEQKALGLAAVLDSRLPAAALLRAIERVYEGAPTSEESPRLRVDPDAEDRRLARIAALNVVDPRAPEPSLQRLVEDTAHAFHVPVALVSIMLRDRQWFKAYFGIAGDLVEERGSSREVSFCQHIVESRTALVVPDARKHPVLGQYGAVKDGLVGSYCGVPLTTIDGEVLGTLCLVDSEPRAFARDTMTDLAALSRRVAGELEVLASARKPRDQSTTRARLKAVVANLEGALCLVDPQRTVVVANPALAELAGVAMEELVGKPREVLVEKLAPIFEDPADYRRRTRVLASGPYVGREDFVAKSPRRMVRWTAKPIEMGDGAGHLETYTELPSLP